MTERVPSRPMESTAEHRPRAPDRRPSNMYNPPRNPYSSRGLSASSSTQMQPMLHDPNQAYLAQETEYVHRLRYDPSFDYFASHASSQQQSSDSDSELEDQDLSTPGYQVDTGHYSVELVASLNNESYFPATVDLEDAANRERFEWHQMLTSVLTGDVVKQETKRQFAFSEVPTEEALRHDLWFGIGSRVTDVPLASQKRLVEEGRKTVDASLDEISRFKIQSESETGQTALAQVTAAIDKIDVCESLYPCNKSLLEASKAANTALYKTTYDSLVSWHNTHQMIELEMSILRKWVGNEELDFLKAKAHSLSDNDELLDDSSFLDRLLKEDQLTSLYKSSTNMLVGINHVVTKAKETLMQNYEAFCERHLPLYIDDLLTLISFPPRLIQETIKVRLLYATKSRESARQNVIIQDQMINQFQILLKLAVKIKNEYEILSSLEPGWDLPPCIDESFDQVVLDALRYYCTMVGWKLSSNKNAFKEAEILEHEWGFCIEVGEYLQGGDVEVSEQFSSLTHKAVLRLNRFFEKELRDRPQESPEDLERRYKTMMDSVRVRQRMLQRFSGLLSDELENATDFSILLKRPLLEDLYTALVTSGHFLVYTATVEYDGIFILASPTLWNRPNTIQAMLGAYASSHDILDHETSPYLLILRPKYPIPWTGRQMSDAGIREPTIDVKVGQLRLIAQSSGAYLHNARSLFQNGLDDIHLSVIVEQRSNLHLVDTKLVEIKKVANKLSNMIMDSVQVIRRQTRGMNKHELVQNCFIFAADFGQRSLLRLDRDRAQMIKIRLNRLALDWVTFICDDCLATEKRTFRWAVTALEFAMIITTGSSILSLGKDEYAKFRSKVGGCMSLLISHFDIMGARSSLAARAEKLRLETSYGINRSLNATQAISERQKVKAEGRIAHIEALEEHRKARELEGQVLGHVLEYTDADRSLMSLSSSAANITVRWQQGNFVGGGTFGTVYSAINLDTGHLMAVKEIRLQDPQLIPSIAAAIRDEMNVLEVLDHPNVISYYGIEVHRDKVYIFMEFCSGGSLASQLAYGRIEDEQIILIYAYQLVEGLAYLHKKDIVHRDIKPESRSFQEAIMLNGANMLIYQPPDILLDHTGIIKYVDFGAAKMLARQGKTLISSQSNVSATAANRINSAAHQSVGGTPMYMAPEVIKSGSNPDSGSDLTNAVDIWSLGCVILEMATGRRPWANLDNEYAVMYSVGQGEPPQLPTAEEMSELGIDFLKKCFIWDPVKRATATELLQHEWILQISSQVTTSASSGDNVPLSRRESSELL